MASPELIGAPPPDLRRDRRLQLWIAACVISWIGNSTWTVGLAWQAVRSFPAGQAGVVVAVAMIPQAVLTLLGGVLADRCDTRAVMVIGQTSQAVVLVIGARLWGRVPDFGLLVIVGIVFGIIAGLTSPASATLGRQLVAAENLTKVAGWNQVGGRLARLAGSPLGAWIVARYGLVAVMLVDAASFALSLVILLVVVRPRYRIRAASARSWHASLAEGIGYLVRDRLALVFVIGMCGLNVFASPLETLGVPLRVSAQGWPATTLGLIDAVFAAASIVGSFLGIVLRLVAPAVHAYRLLMIQAFAYAGIALPTRVGLALSMAVVGLTAGLASVWLSGEFVRIVDPAHLGRVVSVSNLGDLVLVPLATPLFGLLTSHLGIGASPLAMSGLMAVMCGSILARPEIRRLGAGDCGAGANC